MFIGGKLVKTRFFVIKGSFKKSELGRGKNKTISSYVKWHRKVDFAIERANSAQGERFDKARPFGISQLVGGGLRTGKVGRRYYEEVLVQRTLRSNHKSPQAAQKGDAQGSL